MPIYLVQAIIIGSLGEVGRIPERNTDTTDAIRTLILPDTITKKKCKKLPQRNISNFLAFVRFTREVFGAYYIIFSLLKLQMFN